MNDLALGEVIAERHLECRQRRDGLSAEVVVRVGKPLPDTSPGGDWYCPFRIVGLGDDTIRAAYGFDSVQALMLAFKLVGSYLQHFQHSLGDSITWLGEKDLGFPVPEG